MKFTQWVSAIALAGRELLGKSNVVKKSSIDLLCQQLNTSKGEALGTALAYEVVQAYQALDTQGQIDFFTLLLNDYSINAREIVERANHYAQQSDGDSYRRLARAMRSPRRTLFRRINVAPNGTATLIQMRHDLLRLLPEHAELVIVDVDLKDMMVSWFNRGFLTLEQISWQTSAHILEKLIAYEAVHEMSGWDDLRRRLAQDRHCYAFFHPAIEAEPLIFVEVALVKGIATNIQNLLAASEPQVADTEQADTAVFYSISNCQQGLKGISFGNFLIKQVVYELQRDCPHLTQFVTLSPIPGFSRWLNRELENDQSDIFSEDERQLIALTHSQDWHGDIAIAEQVKPLLLRLCAHYLFHVKRGNEPGDAVSRFHLGNGALIDGINWLGDCSERGITQSFGMLVNYAYQLDKVEANHEALVNQGTVAISSRFQKQLKV